MQKAADVIYPSSAGGGALYTVKSGDTLSAIASAHGTDVQSILKANPGITNGDLIQPGQILNVPAVSG